MSQCADTEDRVLPSKEQQGWHNEATRSEQQQRPSPPEPSRMSGKSQQSAETQVPQQRSGSPLSSNLSMKSEWSMEPPLCFNQEKLSVDERVPQQRSGSPLSSNLSMKSEWSMEPPLCFKQEKLSVDERVLQQRSEVHSCQSGQQDQSDLDSIFTLLEEKIITFVKTELQRLQRILSPAYQACSEKAREEEDLLASKGEEQTKSAREAFVKITLHFLKGMNQEELAICLQTRANAAICHHKLKSDLSKKFQHLFEGIAKAGNPTPLNQIYTELYIIEGGTGEVNDEHEVRQIEAASRRRARLEKTITCKNIFQPLVGREKPVRTVLTKGVAGIGKTVLTQKFTLDWAEDKANQDIHFTFPFTFRELNGLKEEKLSLVELVHLFFPETKEAGICSFEDFQVVFIFDGLDECRLPLDFHKTTILTDPTKSTSVDVLLTNLIKGKLLPNSRLWITTRPALASQIHLECVDMVTEIRGFTDPQKDEFFRKRFRDEEMANRIISHVKASQSLYIMCHIPVFCWITATVLEDRLKSREGGELPKTLTEMYIHFLVVQAKVKKVKYDGGAETDSHWSPESRKMIESLGKLAFEHLQKGNLIFYESDLTECGIDIRAASVYSGVFTQIFKEERGLYQNKVFCFVHLSVQEFLAALHVHLTFINSGLNLLGEEQQTTQTSRPENKQYELKLFYQIAVEEALQSPNGYLDMFLRFLLGLSLQSNQSLLQGLLKETGLNSQINQEAARYIRENIGENLSPERSINLFHCLNELNDHSLVEEIQRSLTSGRLFIVKLSPAQWSALVFILLSSQKDLDEFDLRKYSASEDGLMWLLPVVKASSKSLMIGCNLSNRSCKALSSVLTKSSSLRELDLRYNNLQDSGVKEMFEDLEENCKLEVLRLSGCELSWRSCKTLSRVFSSPSSALGELELNNNDLKDSTVIHLFPDRENQLSTLKIVRLAGCNLSNESCEALALVLSSQSSSMIELDLSNNDLQDSGVKQLSCGLNSPHCKLETLSLSGCLITEKGCASLGSALSSNPSHLRKLDLSYNHPGPAGVKLFSAALQDPRWHLDSLSMDSCGAERLKPGRRKYGCSLTMDQNTIHRNLYLSHNIVTDDEECRYPSHAERFQYWYQLMCTSGLVGRCYWEVDWCGLVSIGVTYRGIKRSGSSDDSRIGGNNNSWSLDCSADGYAAWHNNSVRIIDSPAPFTHGNRVGVYLDWLAGTVSFYRVICDTLTHIHTFQCSFTEPLYPVFRIRSEFTYGVYNSVALREMDEED